MPIPIQKKCLNHSDREAAALCLECRQFFCRECVTEHEDRVVCTRCLKKLAGAGAEKTVRFALLSRLGSAALGLVAAWCFFYWFGQALTAIPTPVHEGTVWSSTLEE